MKPLSRHGVNKSASASTFKHNTHKTKVVNTASAPMRGGWRL